MPAANFNPQQFQTFKNFPFVSRSRFIANIFIVSAKEGKHKQQQQSLCISFSRHYCRYQLSFYLFAENVITLRTEQ